MASDSAPSEAAFPERPRLVINGVPVQPEDLCCALSAAVQHRLSVAPVRVRRSSSHGRRAPRAAPSAGMGRTSWALSTVCLMGGLVLALWLLWR